MKVYIVSVDGVEVGLTRATGHNAAEAAMQKKFPGVNCNNLPRASVAYTEIGPDDEKKFRWL